MRISARLENDIRRIELCAGGEWTSDDLMRLVDELRKNALMDKQTKVLEALIRLLDEVDATPKDIVEALPEAWEHHSAERFRAGQYTIDKISKK